MSALGPAGGRGGKFSQLPFPSPLTCPEGAGAAAGLGGTLTEATRTVPAASKDAPYGSDQPVPLIVPDAHCLPAAPAGGPSGTGSR